MEKHIKLKYGPCISDEFQDDEDIPTIIRAKASPCIMPERPLINMDETTVQVLKEPGRKPENKSYLWRTVGSNKNRKIVLFNYSQTRKEEIARSLLDGFPGILQTDGYAGYNKVVRVFILYHVGCLAHARRKFYKAAKATKSGGKSSKAQKLIQKIFKIEKELRTQGLISDVFFEKRRQLASPVWEEYHRWLNVMESSVPPGKILILQRDCF